MPNNPTNITNVTPPRVPLTDQRTGLISREWYRFFLNLFQLVGQGQNQISLLDVQYGPPGGTANPSDTGNPGIAPDPLPAELLSDYAEIQKQVNGLKTVPEPQLGTLSSVNQDFVQYLGFDTAPPWMGTKGGQFWYDSTTGQLNIQQGANVTQQIGEEVFTYVRASDAITEGQVIARTGTDGTSGYVKAAPAPIGTTDPDLILGIATENIAKNSYGRITWFGVVHGLSTSPGFADGDDLFYDPTVVGGYTKTKPVAPNLKLQIGTIIKAAGGTNGSIQVKLGASSALGGTDSNVQFGTLATNDLIQYNGTYWTNVAASSIAIGTATNLAGGAAGSVPYQTGPSATTFLGIGTAGQYLNVNSGATAPQWSSPAALTKTDDTNVTLTLGGSASTALLNAASMTLGWAGQLAVSRGGTGLSSGTSGGIPYFSSSSAMTSSAALTQYGVVYGGGAGAAPASTAAGTNGQVLTAVTGGAPVWAAPATSGTVTSVSVVSANGFAGTVATATSTPAITISTSVTGLLYGNGTAIAAATVSSPLSYSAGTLSLASGYGDTQNPYASKTANYVLAAPNGSAGAPTFRALVASDIPSLPYQPTQAPVTYTANFSVAATDVWVINNKSGSSCTATLPAASSYSGRVLRFQNYQGQTLVSASSNVVPIAGGAAGTAILAAVAGDTATLVSDGTNWIMTQYVPNNILLLE